MNILIYIKVFFDLAIELSENIGINKHIINLIKGKQVLYRPIYAFKLIELEILKAYIKTYRKIWVITVKISCWYFYFF